MVWRFAQLRRYRNWIMLVLTLVVYAALCLMPFILYSQHPLGYDTGFYRRYLIQFFISFPNTAVPGLDHTIIMPRIFLDSVRFFGFSPDYTLYGSYILLLLIFAAVFYYFVRAYTSTDTASYALLFLILSPIQYLGFWFMLYKNFFALIFFFLTLTFLKKKWYIPLFICSLIIPLSHQSTTIIFLGTLSLYILFTTVQEKRISLQELSILCCAVLVYLYLHPHVQQKIDTPPVGVFIEKKDFLLMTMPLIFSVLIGLKKYFRLLKDNTALLAFGSISILFPLLSLPYYQRIFLFTNYFLIIGAALGIQRLCASTKHQKIYLLTVVLLFIFQSTLLGIQVSAFRPLVSPDTMLEIESLQNHIPSGASLITSPRLTPWAQGWTTAKIYAPGILKDMRNTTEWHSFWAGTAQEKIAFLSQYPRPLYIFIDTDQRSLYIPDAQCIQKISPMLYQDLCADELK